MRARGFITTMHIVHRKRLSRCIKGYKGLRAVLSGIVPKMMAIRFAGLETYKERLAHEIWAEEGEYRKDSYR
jgi:hypothetical protein